MIMAIRRQGAILTCSPEPHKAMWGKDWRPAAELGDGSKGKREEARKGRIAQKLDSDPNSHPHFAL